MCYPSPGPRCSSHAASMLATAITYKEELENGSTEEIMASYARVEEAQDVFDATPAGLKILEDALQQNKNSAQQVARYERAKAVRASQMQALKDLNLTKVKHLFAQPAKAFDSSFPADDVVRRNDNLDQTMTDINDSAAPWINKLDDDEMAQLRWMSDYGAMESNTHIAGVNSYTGNGGIWSANNIEERMQFVDSALSKYRSEEPVIVYRGVREGMLPAPMRENYRLSTDTKQETYLSQFKVGETFESEYYMPTSFMPETAKRFSDFNVVMEIKTKHAAPIAPLSLSRTEQEALLPRGSKYKVIAIKEDVQYARGAVGPSLVTVIQLEDVS